MIGYEHESWKQNLGEVPRRLENKMNIILVFIIGYFAGQLRIALKEGF